MNHTMNGSIPTPHPISLLFEIFSISNRHYFSLFVIFETERTFVWLTSFLAFPGFFPSLQCLTVMLA